MIPTAAERPASKGTPSAVSCRLRQARPAVIQFSGGIRQRIAKFFRSSLAHAAGKDFA